MSAIEIPQVYSRRQQKLEEARLKCLKMALHLLFKQALNQALNANEVKARISALNSSFQYCLVHFVSAVGYCFPSKFFHSLQPTLDELIGE